MGGSSSGALRGAFIAGATAFAFQQIGDYFEGISGVSPNAPNNFGGNLLTGGQVTQQIAAHAIVGCIAADLQGGKFSNGAVTGVFSRLLNDDARSLATNQEGQGYEVRNPKTGEIEVIPNEMQPVYKEDGSIKTFNGRIVTQHRSGKMELATELSKGQASLEACSAYKKCMNEFWAKNLTAPTTKSAKPIILGTSSPARIKITGNSWFVAGSNAAAILGVGIKYFGHAQSCAVSSEVAKVC
jgi:hypothetical protein